ncbi:hypothetical protein EV424DRAFT_1347535 [Suillus variegatus]|nr:hypothetical protein EV424DRAFT_1347535 [Suillus variegatus]
MALKIKWHNNDNLTILNVYAPNNTMQHPEFWGKINEKWQEKNLPHPDFMLGDVKIQQLLNTIRIQVRETESEGIITSPMPKCQPMFSGLAGFGCGFDGLASGY